MDNVIIATTNNLTHHWNMVKAVLQAFKNTSLFLKLEKIEFKKEHVEYLGLLLNSDTIKSDPSKI